MDWQWLWQGLLTNWLAAVLVLGCGIILTYLRAKRPSWAAPTLYGLGACALTSSLTEDTFMERVTEIDFVLTLAREAIVLGLYRLTKDPTALGFRLVP